MIVLRSSWFQKLHNRCRSLDSGQSRGRYSLDRKRISDCRPSCPIAARTMVLAWLSSLRFDGVMVMEMDSTVLTRRVNKSTKQSYRSPPTPSHLEAG